MSLKSRNLIKTEEQRGREKKGQLISEEVKWDGREEARPGFVTYLGAKGRRNPYRGCHKCLIYENFKIFYTNLLDELQKQIYTRTHVHR